MVANIISSLAAWFISLEALTFPSIGSLYPSETEHLPPVVGPLVSFEYQNPAAPYFLGPFRSNKERWLAMIDLMLEQISQGRRDPYDPVTEYLAKLELREMVAGCDELDDDTGPFYIKHADDKGDQVLFDENWVTTGIIDWEW
jgi:hypothetical protein